MQKYIEIAGEIVKISSPIRYKDGKHIKKFYSERKDFIISYEIVYVDDLPEVSKKPLTKKDGIIVYCDKGSYYIFYYYGADIVYACGIEDIGNPNHITILVKKNALRQFEDSDYLLSFLSIEHIAIILKGIVLHSSFIQVKSKGILFLAPSSGGKSTQASLWEKFKNAEVINGDKALIKKQGKIYYGYSLPYCGTSDLCKNKSVELKAIVMVEKSKNNNLIRVSGTEAFKALISQCTINQWRTDDVSTAIEIIKDIQEKVPIYKLFCAPEEEAVNLLAMELEM